MYWGNGAVAVGNGCTVDQGRDQDMENVYCIVDHSKLDTVDRERILAGGSTLLYINLCCSKRKRNVNAIVPALEQEKGGALTVASLCLRLQQSSL